VESPSLKGDPFVLKIVLCLQFQVFEKVEKPGQIEGRVNDEVGYHVCVELIIILPIQKCREISPDAMAVVMITCGDFVGVYINVKDGKFPALNF
jgi:hypothetical protein